MRVYVVVAALLGAATAQDLSGIPGCALVCALGAGKKAGCTSGDVKCFCSSASAMSQAQACVQSSCSESDAKKAVTGAATLCSSVGISPPVEARSSPAAPATSPAGDSKPAPEKKEGASSAAVAAGSTSCVTLSSTQASRTAQVASTTSQPAVFTGAARQVRGAGAVLAGAAIMVAAAL